MSVSGVKSPLLLVQCCHLPQFLFVARNLREQNPGKEIHALVLDQPRSREQEELLETFPRVHLASASPASLQDYTDIVLPLLNRGYVGLKRRVRRLPGRCWESDYSGLLRPLTGSRLLRSCAAAIHPVPPGFVEFLEEFPDQALGKEILVVNSAHESIHEICGEPLRKLLRRAENVTFLDASSLRSARRQLKGRSFDGAVVFFSGEPGLFHLKILPFLLGIPRIAVFNENGRYFFATLRGLLRFWWQRLRHGTRLPNQIPCILLMQTEAREYVAGAARTLRERQLYPDSRVVVLCKEEDRDYLSRIPEIDEAITYTRSNQIRKTRQVLRELAPEIVAAVFSGRPVFRASKLLFLAQLDRPQLVFNAGLDCYWVGPRTLGRLRERGTLKYGLDQPKDPLVLVVQTEGLPYLREVVKLVQGAKFYPGARVAVLARQADADSVRQIPGVTEVLSRRPGEGLLALRKRGRKLRPDAIFAIFTGRPGHGWEKLFFLLHRRLPRGIFNARLDAYWFSLRTLPNLFRNEPLILAEKKTIRVALIQTESSRSTLAAARRIRSRKLFPQAEITLFCREEDRLHLQDSKHISSLQTLSGPGPAALRADLRRIRKLKPDVLSALFSGNRTYLSAKALFLASRISSKLVFNASLDAYWLSWKTILNLFRHEPLLFADERQKRQVVLLQTESWRNVAAAAERLHSAKLFPDSEVIVFARPEDARHLEGNPAISRVLNLSPSNWKGLRRDLREIRGLRPDAVSAIFSNPRTYPVGKLLFLLCRNRQRLVFNGSLDCYWLRLRTMLRLLRREPLLFSDESRQRRVVLLQTESWRNVAAAAERLKSAKLFPASNVIVFARPEDARHLEGHPAISQVLALSPSNWQGLRRDLGAIRRLQPDAVSAIFSNPRTYPVGKLLFLLCRSPHRLVFNGSLDCYWLRLRTIPRLLRREPLLFSDESRQRRVVLLQTESWRNVAAAAERLQSDKLFPSARVFVFARPLDVPRLESNPAISRVLAYSGSHPRGLRRDLAEIRRLQPDAISAIFSSPRTFPSGKALFLLTQRAPRLVFNGSLDCYWLRLRTLPRLLRREPLLFGEDGRTRSDVLLVQTEERARTVRALDRMIQDRVVPGERVSVFCSPDDAPFFENHPRVDQVFRYYKGSWSATWKELRRLRRERWDVVAGLFTGRPIYRLQKMLFLFLPARHRLVFNPGLDCFYLKRGRIARAFRLPTLYVPIQGRSGALPEILRKGLRGIMFLPRFAYLMAWLSVVKLKRAHR